MSIRAHINENYVAETSSVSAFDSPVIDLALPHSAISYQIEWEAGVVGEITWKAAIKSGLWETLVACEEVSLVVDGTAESAIVAIPNIWFTVGYLKFSWVPNEGSTGNISAAIRVVPI